MKLKQTLTAATVALVLAASGATANQSLEGGWTVEPDSATVTFLSIKQHDVMELSSFSGIHGQIDAAGVATVTIDLESVDTGIELRDVRMRAFLLETDTFPVANITATITDEMLADLSDTGSKEIILPFNLDLHGMVVSREVSVVVTLHGERRVSIISNEPIFLHLADFDLLRGIAALEEAAGVTIAPITGVLFNVSFQRASSDLAN